MSFAKTPWTRVTMLLCALALHSCQQTPLNVVGDEPTEESPQTPQLLSTQPKQSTNATKEQEPCCIVLTSSSDSSPDTKHTDSESLGRDATAQSIANAPQGSTMAAANADAIAADANREVSRKRPATTQVGKHNEKLPATKHAEKETPSRSHEAWFTAFANATEQIEEDSEDEEAWEKMEKLLDEDGKNNFLTASITFPNDSNPAAEYEYTPLHYAAAKGLLALVKELVKQRNVAVDITTQDNKSTPLHLAASRGHLHVVQFLVDQGADPKLLDSDEGSALQYAAAGRRGERNRDVIEYLVEKGADDLTKLTKTGISMLGLAVCSNNISVIEYWIDRFSNDSNPEIIALTKRAWKMASRLKEKGHRSQGHIARMLKEFLEDKSH
jgi:Ankyrin repeats (3 copies)